MKLFPKSIGKTHKSQIQITTIRGFSGGLNTVEDDLSMQPRYVVGLTNFRRTPSGGQALRFGQIFLTDIADTNNSPIVDQSYFNNRLINVCANGKIVTVTDAGVKAVIWSDAIAATLPGAPTGWAAGVTLVTFVPWRDKLIIHDGVDKPIIIASDFTIKYLQDEGTGSNTNVPIGKYGCIASDYHCIAGIPGSPTIIVISAQSTSGTFPGDPSPNDSLSIDVGAYAPEGAAEIRGIAGYRSYLFVFLQQITLQVQLGVYDDADPPNHTPKFPDNFPTFGLVGSRCIFKIDNDLVFGGLNGLASASQSQFVSGQMNSDTQSAIIDPTYRKELGLLTDTQKKMNTFFVFDELNHDLIIFYPGGKALVYTTNKKLNYRAWTTYDSMDWDCGCTSLLGRMFLCKGTKIFQSGNDVFGETYNADRIDDRDATWANDIAVTAGTLYLDADTDEIWKCVVSHTTPIAGTFLVSRTAIPTNWVQYFGIPIDFFLEMPWISGRNPMQNKKNKYVSVETKGTAEFTLKIYVDNLYKDKDGSIVYDPALALDFIGNDAPGYGLDLDTDLYGTGRRSADGRLWKYPVKFKKAKFVFTGSTTKPLTLVNMSFLFVRGGYMRP